MVNLEIYHDLRTQSQENANPENPNEQINSENKENQNLPQNFDVESLIKLLEVVEKLKQSDKSKLSQSELFDFINEIVSTEQE